MNLHDHIFSLVYLLLDEKLIHQYILPDNHFCKQGSRSKKIKQIKLIY